MRMVCYKLYSTTILTNKLSLILQNFLKFESDKTSDWLYHVVNPIGACVTFKTNNVSECVHEYNLLVHLNNIFHSECDATCKETKHSPISIQFHSFISLRKYVLENNWNGSKCKHFLLFLCVFYSFPSSSIDFII